MYSVEGYVISLSRGDTGALVIDATATLDDQPFTFGENDRAIFSVKNAQGEIVLQKVSAITNNSFTVFFLNEDTDKLASGNNYSWDVRYIINPYYQDGKIVNGDQVLTPVEPKTMNILAVVGEV